MKKKERRRLKRLLEETRQLSKKAVQIKRTLGEVIEYDPSDPPHPENWLMLGESERMVIVEEFHRKTGLPFGEDIGGERLHVVFHCIAENQIAMGDEDALDLFNDAFAMSKDRHEAIHELGRKISQDVFRTHD